MANGQIDRHCRPRLVGFSPIQSELACADPANTAAIAEEYVRRIDALATDSKAHIVIGLERR